MGIRGKLSFLSKLSQLFDRREKWEFAGIMGAALSMAIFQALGVASIIPFISLVVNPDIVFENEMLLWTYNFFGFETVRSFIIAVGVAMLAIIVTGNLITAFAIWLKTRFAWEKNHSVSTALIKKYLSLPYSYFLTKNTADLSKNVLQEVQNFTSSFLLPMLEIITDSIVLLIIFATLILISPAATATILGMFGVIYWVMTRSGMRGKLKKRGKLRLEENKGRYQAASEALGGIKDIKLLGREGFFIDKFAGHSLKFSGHQSWNAIVGQLPRYIIETIAFGGVIVFVLILMLTRQDFGKLIPMVSFFAFAGYRIMPTLNKMFVAFTKLQFNKAVLDSLYRDLTEQGDEKGRAGKEPEDKEKRVDLEDSIRIRDLSFSYPNMKSMVLENIDMTIRKGESIAVVGATGTGKTTFVDLVLGLLFPTGGTIEVDGIKITKENVKKWQNDLGYVPQFIYLTDDTVKRNIAFGIGDSEIDMDKVEKAARISNLHDFIVNELPLGYDTVVGERGIRLSGGQRQRVGIARALYNDPDVLVLDEATSSLDGITEEAVFKAIENISKLKTLIMIAHRLTTVKKCDRIYFLDKGMILAEGNYAELMEKNTQFKAMARET